MARKLHLLVALTDKNILWLEISFSNVINQNDSNILQLFFFVYNCIGALILYLTVILHSKPEASATVLCPCHIAGPEITDRVIGNQPVNRCYITGV